MKTIATSRLEIDRPRGSPHPRYPSFIYPFDYGHLENTQSGDGAGIDVRIGSLPKRCVTAVICTVDLEKRDTEMKILLGCTPQEVQQILDIHNRGSQSAVLVKRVEVIGAIARKAYIAIKYHQDNRNREQIEKISNAFEQNGVSSPNLRGKTAEVFKTSAVWHIFHSI